MATVDRGASSTANLSKGHKTMTHDEYKTIARFLDRLQTRVEFTPEKLPMKAEEANIVLSWARARLTSERQIDNEMLEDK